MGKAGVGLWAYNICKSYAVSMTIFFAIWDFFVWMAYISDENIGEYCIYVPSTAYHHFRLNEENACLIDWWYFVKEPLLTSVLVYLVLVGPALLGWYVLRDRGVFNRSPESGRVWAYGICKSCGILGTLLFAIWNCLNLLESETDGSFIVWWHSIDEALLTSVLVYLVVVGPALLGWYVLRRGKGISRD